MEPITLPHTHGTQNIAPDLTNELDNIEKFQLAADIFKQLGDTTRIRLFWLLCHCEECVMGEKEPPMEPITLPHTHGTQNIAPDLTNELDNIEKFQLAADIFKQLGDTTRIRLFWLLCHCEECVINISAMLNMSSPAVSHHLRLLRSSGLIVSRREGKEVYYQAAKTPQSQLLHQIIEQVLEIACPT